jgi:predicted dehydrogenase
VTTRVDNDSRARIRLAFVGAGSRGSNYARIAAADGDAVIAAVVEPDPDRLAMFLTEHGSGAVRVFSSWDELAAAGTAVADAAVVSTPDHVHTAPAIALASAGLHILLEKPMAPTEAESIAIVNAVREAGVMLAVCHVMRYSKYTQVLKNVIDDGIIGDIVSVEHLEPIGWWHFAHSFVRGNWAREDESNPMLMAKSSHDIDWLTYIIGKRASSVSSFGSLFHFKPARKPIGAANRCVDCPLQYECAYSATKIYPRFLGDPVGERWPLSVLTPIVTSATLDTALREGPYGECVFNGRNDVVDHQVVNLEYDGGVTASFTVTAFTDLDFRKTRIFGTEGSIDGDGRTLTVLRFASDSVETIETTPEGGASAADGHGGADTALVSAFLRAVKTGDRSHLLSGPTESLDAHRIIWRAEESRKSGRTLHFDDSSS